MIDKSDLSAIYNHVASMGEFVPEQDRDALARIIQSLSDATIIETVEIRLLQLSQVSAVIGYLESKWRAVENRSDNRLNFLRADSAKRFRALNKDTGERITEARVEQAVDTDEVVDNQKNVVVAAKELADIFQSLRYSIKNLIDGLLEMARTERVDRRMNA